MSSIRPILSGEKRGPTATLIRGGLRLVEPLYAAGIALHGLGWNLGLRKPAHLPVPVASIGNLTAGGTGKTPMTAWVAGFLRSRGVKPVVLMRGYHATGGKSDEAVLLEEEVPGLSVCARPDRVRAARDFLDSGRPCDVFLLDDGFQHRRLHRDLNLVLIDALCPFGHGHLLPRGLLREPPAALKRADAVILTRCDQVDPSRVEEIDRQIQGLCGQAAMARASFLWSGLLDENDRPVSPDAKTPVFAACGVGHPESFFRQAAQSLYLSGSLALPDHHAWIRADLDRCARRAAACGAAALLVSGKDWVKIRELIKSPLPLPVWRPRLTVEFHAGRDRLESLLLSLLSGRPGTRGEREASA